MRLSEIESLLVENHSRQVGFGNYHPPQPAANTFLNVLKSKFRGLNPRFFSLVFQALLLSIMYYQFFNISTEVLVERFGYKFEDTNRINTVIPATAVLLAPLFSKMIEVGGRKPSWMVFSSLLAVVNYWTMYQMQPVPSISVFIAYMGIGTNFAITSASMFSSMALSVSKEYVSFSFSIWITVSNISGMLSPMIMGMIAEKRTAQAYSNCLFALFIVALVSTVSSVIIFIFDAVGDHLLSFSENSLEVRRIRNSLDEDDRI